MRVVDYLIIAVVAGLFIWAFIAYKKKPRSSCGNSGGCGGNCTACGGKCENNRRKRKTGSHFR